MTEIRRTLLLVVLMMSLLMLFDKWRVHHGEPSLLSPRPVAKAVVAPSAALAALGPVRPSHARDHTHGSSSGGFWTTAWPYIIGGAALAAGGAAVYFASRPTDDVNVGAARVELVH